MPGILFERPDSLIMPDVLRHWADKKPDEPALVFLGDGENETDRLTFGELEKRARSVANQLLSYGAGGKCAVLLYPPSLDFVAAFWGCLYAGVIAIPVYPPKSNRNQLRLSGIINDAEPAFALSTRAELQRWADGHASSQELESITWLATDDYTNTFENVRTPTISPDSLAFLQYSSGSTGVPKGIMVSHGNLVHNLEYLRTGYFVESDSISVSWLPFFHDMGLVLGLLEPLYAGICGILMPPAAFTQRPLRWLKAVSDYRATHTGGPNFAYDLCVRRISEAEREDLDLRSWQLAYNGAEPVRRASLEQFADTFGPCGFHRKALSPGYGLAEFTLFVSGSSPYDRATYLDVSASALERNEVVAAAPDQESQCLVGCGRPTADVRVEIVHPKTCAPLPPGNVGEIWLSSRSVAKGYWNKPEETENTFEACLTGTQGPRFLRTGDLGFLKDGELFITGRLKDVVIIRGRNLYPQDIEFTAERSNPALRAGFGAAFSVPVDGEERLVVIYEIERSMLRGIDVDQVAYATENAILEEHEVKAHEVLLLKTGAIPKTSSGKIQRRACRAAYLSGSLDALGQRRVAAGSTVVKPIARKDEELALRIFPIVSEFVWQTRGRHALLKRESRIRADLGLDSLDVTVLTAKLEEAIGVSIDLSKIDHLDTVDDLVQIIGTVLTELEKSVDSLELTLERSRNEIPRMRANGLDSTASTAAR